VLTKIKSFYIKCQEQTQCNPVLFESIYKKYFKSVWLPSVLALCGVAFWFHSQLLLLWPLEILMDCYPFPTNSRSLAEIEFATSRCGAVSVSAANHIAW